ncbi:hypothetical protein O4158_10115 [Gordonia amicalis]|uniref:hypothetical protein n=1 Tax=Gordonia amicalis TaxID=89053 RepID=UPI0022B3D3E9|nr:hypothetical protein [Gordonia amicalis]MCZ4579431.1 hypothetical protein [Gordonia amicalis]
MSAKGWHRVASSYWWGMLALSVVVSSYGNVRHAELIAPAEVLTEAKWIGGALPVTLLLMVEGIAFGVRSGVAGWQRTLATVIVGSLGVVVLASSYIGLLSVVEGTMLFTADTRFLNYGLAAVPDLLMIASTVYVMSLRRQAEAEVSEARQPSRWSRITGNLLDRVESATEAHSDAGNVVPELSSTGVDTDNEAVVDTDIDRRQWADRRPIVNDRRIVDGPVVDEGWGRRQAVIDDRQWPVDSGFAQVEPVVDTDIDSRQPVDNEVVNSVDQARVDSVVTDNGRVIDSVDSTVNDDRQVVDDIDNGPVDNAPEPVDSVVDDTPTADIDEIVNGRHRADDGADNDSELAAAVVAETNTKVPAEGVAEALRRRREGDSYASIAEAIGIGSHSTVRSLVKAATKLDAAYAAALGEPHRPDLAVVSSQ